MAEIVTAPNVVKQGEDRNLHRSTFPQRQVRQTTEQFGLVKPHVVIDGVSDSSFKYRADYVTRSYTLKAPLMQDVHRHLTYFKVDMPTILPLNFDKFFTNPVVGQDVPDDVGCYVENGYLLIYQAVQKCFNTYFSLLYSDNSDTPVGTFVSHLTSCVKTLIFAELFYSRGSLLSSLGCRISPQLKFYSNADKDSVDYTSFDKFFDAFFGWLTFKFPRFVATIDGLDYSIDNSSPDRSISWLRFLDMIRDTSNWSFKTNGISVDTDDLPTLALEYLSFSGSSNAPFFPARVFAYQLAVAEFMTNDKVDNNYNAELFRQYIGSLLRSFYSNAATYDTNSRFSVNGISYLYDYLSGHWLNLGLSIFRVLGTPFESNPAVLQFFLSLFGYRRSLRFKDYFVSSRVSPLAVGDVSVNVVDNSVNVVDVSQRIQVQRFLNRVNRIGRNLSNYIRGIFGVDLAPDRHVPHYLVDIDELVYTAEVENTADAQQTENNSVTAVFSGNSGTREIEFFIDVPCVVIGVTSYDIERSYINTIDRNYFIRNRFDMFIPEMQFVGDQAIYCNELESDIVGVFDRAFGYQFRDMQYKMMYNIADGGFVEYLPGYAFLYKTLLNRGDVHVNSDFIRSLPAELDEFYLSMVGFSLASRFHFITLITNNIEAKLPMIAHPNILD